MSKKISNKTRNKAAYILSVCASTNTGSMFDMGGVEWVYMQDVEPGFTAARELAGDAYLAADKRVDDPLGNLRYAEAEAMLRTGWTP